MSAGHDPPETPDAEEPTLSGDEEWAVAEQYRTEPRAPVDSVEGETIVMESGAPPEGAVPGPPARRFPPDVGPGLLAALLGVLLVVILVPAGIWLAGTYGEDENDTTSTLDTTTEPTTTTTTPPTRTVPDVVGLQLPQARQRLREDNLDVRFRRVASEQPRNEVLRQAPRAGVKAPPDGIVVLTVSGGSDRLVLPRVEGFTVAEATAILRDAGLRWQINRVTSTEPAGTVIGQTPAAGEEIDRSTVVVLEVADAPPPNEPETVEVPNLVGLTSSEARSSLRDLGLRWTQRPVMSSRPKGTVVRQSPGPGAELREGGTVTLTVSTGPARVEIPDVVGLDERSARAELRAAGFGVQVLDEPTADATEDGIVLDQDPRGGASRPKGSVVTITVARFS